MIKMSVTTIGAQHLKRLDYFFGSGFTTGNPKGGLPFAVRREMICINLTISSVASDLSQKAV